MRHDQLNGSACVCKMQYVWGRIAFDLMNSQLTEKTGRIAIVSVLIVLWKGLVHKLFQLTIDPLMYGS